MATKAYDPLVSIEGMFNGSVTRIAQAVKDPLNFGQSTKAVLTECSKRFQDALDDCEIQILDAKWYLEHQLALNRQKREAKAREDGAAVAKRKHDEIKETGDAEGRSQDAKRPKTEDEPVEKSTEQAEPDNVPDLAQAKPETSSKPDNAGVKTAEEPAESVSKTADEAQGREPGKTTKEPKVAAKQPEKPAERPLEEPSNPMDDFPKTTPQVTPAATNDDFNFESMFGEPSVDQSGADNDINFDLDLADNFATNLDTGDDPNQNLSDLSTLMPGLESFENQADNNGANAGSNAAINFDLPDLGPNEFDAFFNDNNLSGDMNLNDDVMNAENLNMDNIDFDSMFKDD